MNLLAQNFVNHYIQSPKIIIHYIDYTLKMYSTFLMLSLLPFMTIHSIITIIIIINFMLLYHHKQFIFYLQDLQYLSLFIITYFFIFTYNIFSIVYIQSFINIFPNYLNKILYVTSIYFITIRLFMLTTPFEYMLNYIFIVTTKIIRTSFDLVHKWILITSCSYQFLDRLVYYLNIIHMFIKLHRYSNNLDNKKVKFIFQLFHKFIQYLQKDIIKITYVLHSRQLHILNFFYKYQ